MLSYELGGFQMKEVAQKNIHSLNFNSMLLIIPDKIYFIQMSQKKNYHQ